MEDLRSVLQGLIPLGMMILVALYLTVTRPVRERDSAARKRLAHIAVAAITLQLFHFLEEASQSFEQRYPDLLGLSPWSSDIFVSFNLFWIVTWVISVVALRWNLLAALFPIWFLGIACVVNAVAHPLMALAAGGYFPGLWTSPFSGLVGALLLYQLSLYTGSRQNTRPTG